MCGRRGLRGRPRGSGRGPAPSGRAAPEPGIVGPGQIPVSSAGRLGGSISGGDLSRGGDHSLSDGWNTSWCLLAGHVDSALDVVWARGAEARRPPGLPVL